MAEVGLHRAQGAEAGPLGAAGAEGLGERRHLDRIAERRAAAVRLDVADRRRLDAGHHQALGDHLRLPLDAGGGEADLAGAVVVHRRAADHGVDAVAVGQGVGQPLEDHHAAAVPLDRPGRAGVEGAAVCPSGGGDAPLLVEVAGAQRRR